MCNGLLLELAACSTPDEGSIAANLVASQSEASPPTSIGIDFFEGSFEDALAHAAQEEKMIFVDVFTIWCGPCVVMQISLPSEKPSRHISGNAH